MPKVALYNTQGEQVGDIELSDAVFGAEVNTDVMHEVVVNYLANQRQGTQSTKTRSEVRGGGRKPWRQKGTGRARQGSIRATQWIKGGIALGPKPRSYSYTVNKKVRRLALKSALSSKVLDDGIIVLEDWKMEAFKTSEVAALLKKLGMKGKTLFILPENDQTIVRSARNIPGTDVSFVGMLNTYDVLRHNNCVILKNAAEKIEEVYA